MRNTSTQSTGINNKGVTRAVFSAVGGKLPIYEQDVRKKLKTAGAGRRKIMRAPKILKTKDVSIYEKKEDPIFGMQSQWNGKKSGK